MLCFLAPLHTLAALVIVDNKNKEINRIILRLDSTMGLIQKLICDFFLWFVLLFEKVKAICEIVDV